MRYLKVRRMKFPDFIIIGETKCGTSSFFEDLAKHPDINASKPVKSRTDYEGGNLSLDQKEIRFFDRHWARGFDWYRDRFFNEDGKITGEASPTYMYRMLSMRRIQEYLPNIKLIIMLRNPVNRLYSHFHHINNIVDKWETRYPSFEEFLDKAHENDYYIIDKGIYINSVRRCYEMFSKEQIHIIKSEDFFNIPTKTYRDTLSFLEVNDSFVPSSFTHIRHSGFKQKIREDTKEHLYEFYKPYNKELYSYIDRDMEW
jgi:hypothetical protein